MKKTYGSCLVAALALLGCAKGGTDDVGDELAPVVEDAGGGSSVTPPSSSGGPSDAGGGTKPDAASGDAGSDATPSTSCTYSGTLVTFDLGSLSGAAPEAAPTSKATGVTATALKRVGVTAVSGSGALNANNWPTGNVDKGKYFTFTVAPPAGCAITLAKLSLTLDASSTGPSSASAGTSVDAFGALRNVPIGNATDVTLQGVAGIGGVVEVRIYGSSAQASSGTLRIDKSLSLSGSLGPL